MTLPFCHAGPTHSDIHYWCNKFSCFYDASPNNKKNNTVWIWLSSFSHFENRFRPNELFCYRKQVLVSYCGAHCANAANSICFAQMHFGRAPTLVATIIRMYHHQLDVWIEARNSSGFQVRLIERGKLVVLKNNCQQSGNFFSDVIVVVDDVLFWLARMHLRCFSRQLDGVIAHLWTH